MRKKFQSVQFQVWKSISFYLTSKILFSKIKKSEKLSKERSTKNSLSRSTQQRDDDFRQPTASQLSPSVSEPDLRAALRQAQEELQAEGVFSRALIDSLPVV